MDMTSEFLKITCIHEMSLKVMYYMLTARAANM